MRFERIVLRAFGRLSELDTGPEELPSLVVVHGPNEAGKTTFFSSLYALLYGIYPANREGNPYTPWSGEDIDVEAELRLDDDDAVRVHRRLLASPWGKLYRDGRETDLRNDTVPRAGHVSKEIFAQVYALTLRDLARLETRTWREVQDRLLGSMGAEDLRSVRKVVEELEEEASGLWRTDNRGKPAAKALEARRRELREAAREARETDRRRREKARELEELRERIEAITAERDARAAEEIRATVLGPARKRLRRIEELEEEAGDPGELAALPDDPRSELARLEEEARTLEGRIEELEERRATLRERVEGYAERDQGLVARAREIRHLVVEAGAIRHATARLAQVETREETILRRARALSRELLSVGWDELDPEPVEELSVGTLRQRLERYREAETLVDEKRARVRALEELTPGAETVPFPFLSLLFVVAGIALGAWIGATGEWTDSTLAVVGALLVFGLVALGDWLRRRSAAEAGRRRSQRALERAKTEWDDASRTLQEARREVARSVEAVPVSPALLERPAGRLADGIEALRELRVDLAEVGKEEEDLRERIEAGEERLDAIAGTVDLELPPDLLAAAARLEEALREAERRRDLAENAERELDEAGDPEELRERLEAVEETLGGLRDEIAAPADGDLDAGLARLEERQEALERARSIRAELEKEHGDVEALESRIREAEEAGEAWASREEDVAAARRRVRELSEELEEMRVREERLRNEIDGLGDRRDLADVEGEVAAVEEELAGVRRRRDRLHLLARLLRTADHRFREENQPDLLRHASRHLGRITGGRYERIWMRDADMEGTLLLRGPGYPEALEVDAPVSTGTRNQVYLALRLAIVDHLDRNGEVLPLFVDEAFVNWDATRLDRGLDLLRELSEERQVFVFTCHASLAGELEERSARCLRLPEPEPRDGEG